VILPISKLGPDGARFEGEDPREVLDWPPSPRDVVRPAGPMRWRLEAQLFGTELLVRGRAEALFEGTCCRCGGPLSRVYGDDFSLSREVGPEETDVDLTSELRETILLALPNNPVCSEDCRPPRPLAEEPAEADGGAASPWSALDALSGGTTHEQPAPPDPKKKPRTRKPRRS
jgi:hypothetical protein